MPKVTTFKTRRSRIEPLVVASPVGSFDEQEEFRPEEPGYRCDPNPWQVIPHETGSIAAAQNQTRQTQERCHEQQRPGPSHFDEIHVEEIVRTGQV